MALADTLIARLVETVKTHDLTGSFLMLGRQRWVGSRRGAAARLMRETLARHLPGTDPATLAAGDGYSEAFFRALGFSDVQSMDISDFEGASLVQDLTAPLAPGLAGRFDVIYDGGTCEHVFDLPTAYRNLHRMLKPGGTLIGHSPCNNWTNHAFYQIGPEMVYGFWERAMGYEVLHLTLQPLPPKHADLVATTTNPNRTGKRPRIKGDLPAGSPLILNYAVRKPLRAPASKGGVYQSDYVQKWQTGP